MSDITDLFHHIAPTESDPSPQTLDSDLARGRAALVRVHRQRTIRRSMMGGGALAAGVAAVLVVAQLGGSSPAQRIGLTHPGPAIASPDPHTRPSIKLVAYHGKQLAGFTVDRIPVGWFLSTSTASALLIDPDGSSDNNPDAFEGKLAVLTSSVDEHGLGSGDNVSVNGRPGVVSDQGKYGLMLRYNDPNGFGVDIQAPLALHWTDAQIVRFAEGVHVTGNAVHSLG
jgi:hypothetical protein